VNNRQGPVCPGEK